MTDFLMPYACTTLPQAGATVLQIAEGHRNRTGGGINDRTT